MASVQIKINASSTPVLNIVQGSTVTLTNGDNAGVASWLWQFIDIPSGSTATLATPSSASTTFVADREGSYEIKLTLNGSLTGTGVAAVLQLQTGIRIPGAFERTEADASRGWAKSLNEALELMEGESRTGQIMTVVSSAAVSLLQPVRVTGETTLTNGDKVATVAPALGDSSAHLPAIGVAIDVAVGSGVKIRVRTEGSLVEGTFNTNGSIIGNPVYVDDTGALSLTSGTIAYAVGLVQTVAVSGRVFITDVASFGELGSTATAVTVDGSSIPGVSTLLARTDHQHTVVSSSASPVDITDSTPSAGTTGSLARGNHAHAHGNRGGGSLHAAATTSVAGFLSAADKTKLDATDPTAYVLKIGDTMTGALSIGSGSNNAFLDLTAGGSAAVSGSNHLRIKSTNVGIGQISENNGTYYKLRNVEWVNVKDPKYAGGAVGDGVVNDTAAFQAAINDTLIGISTIRRCLYIPAGAYRIRATLNVPGSVGFMMQGEGPWASRIIFDPLIPGSDGLIINSSQFVILRDFALWGIKANPTGKMLFFDYNPVVNASTALTMEKLWLASNDADSAFSTGIYWSDAHGNNSEVTAISVVVERFTENGIQMPGSQQKSMNFFACQVNGAWSSDDPDDVTGGKVGVLTGLGPSGFGGSFQWYGGGVSSCRRAGFSINSPNDPMLIDGVQSEHCYRFIGTAGDTPTTPTNGRQCLRVMNCRCDNIDTFDPAGYIQFSGCGSIIFENNTIFSPVGVPQIRLSVGTQPRGSRFTHNQFLSAGSDAVSPFIFDNGAVDYSFYYILDQNTYTDSMGQLSYRNEVLDTQLQNTLTFDSKKRSTDLWAISYTQFAANAATQSVELQSSLLRDQWLKIFTAHIYNYFTHTGGAAIFMKVGTSSGGDELLQEVCLNVSGIGDGHVTYGIPGAIERGTAFDPAGYMWLRDDAVKKIFVTLRVSTGTLGNGTVTNLGRGAVHFQTRYELLPRFIT